MNRTSRDRAADVAYLIARLILGVVLLAHGVQKLMIDGIAETMSGFQAVGVPLAIVSASFVTLVEFLGGALLVIGALTRIVVGLHLIVMIGAAGFVHVTHGIFAEDGGWELVGVIAAAELMLAAVGAGRYSVDHLVAGLRRRAPQSRHGVPPAGATPWDPAPPSPPPPGSPPGSPSLFQFAERVPRTVGPAALEWRRCSRGG